MTILVTGAGGFIGRVLCRRLKSHGHQVTTLSQDITRKFTLAGHFDAVVHLAAYNITHVGSRDPGLYQAVNVEGTRHVVQGVRADKFIFLSTARVYKNEGRPLTEDSLLGPQGAYEQSKLEAEEVCCSLCKDKALMIFRSVNVLGWGQAPKAVVPVFFQKAMVNQPLEIIHAPDMPMQFVYVEDLADAIEATLEYSKTNGIFNIANEETVTLGQLAREILRITHSSSLLKIAQGAPKPVFSPVVCARARAQLGWEAKTPLREILTSYYREYVGLR